MKKEFEAEITKEGYVGYNGWVEECIVSTFNNELFTDIIDGFAGKKVKITIEELEDI